MLAGCSEVSASQEEDPLGWLVGLAEQGRISQEEALLAADSELIGETLLNKGNDNREAMSTLLEWSDEYRRTFIRIYADDPVQVNYTSKESAVGLSMGSLDGYSLLHGPFSQSSSRVAELCRAYLDAAESGHTIHGPDGESAPSLFQAPVHQIRTKPLIRHLACLDCVSICPGELSGCWKQSMKACSSL